MSMHYSDIDRESDPTALPDVEVFHSSACDGGDLDLSPGWYWWSCFPGCLPDGEPNGPFGSKAEALANAQHSD